MPVTENDVETYLTERVEAYGGECYKWVSPGCVGVPDRIVLIPPREIVFVETKAPNGVLKTWQARRHKRLRELGFQVEVIWTKEQVDKFLCAP